MTVVCEGAKFLEPREIYDNAIVGYVEKDHGSQHCVVYAFSKLIEVQLFFQKGSVSNIQDVTDAIDYINYNLAPLEAHDDEESEIKILYDIEGGFMSLEDVESPIATVRNYSICIDLDFPTGTKHSDINFESLKKSLMGNACIYLGGHDSTVKIDTLDINYDLILLSPEGESPYLRFNLTTLNYSTMSKLTGFASSMIAQRTTNVDGLKLTPKGFSVK